MRKFWMILFAVVILCALCIEATALQKNISSQVICAELISKTDGNSVTSGSTAVYVVGDGGVQVNGQGTIAHSGNGLWCYQPTQGETNYTHVAYTFTNDTAIITSVQTYPGAAPTCAGSGNVAVTENTGGTDNLRYVTSGGVGIGGANIVAYLTTDYNAGNTGTAYVKGYSQTKVDGRFLNPLMLNSGFRYTIVFSLPGQYKATAVIIQL